MARHITADGEPEGPDDGAMETAAILSRDLPALAASLVLHVVLLLVLALAGVATPPPTRSGSAPRRPPGKSPTTWPREHLARSLPSPS